MKKLKFSIVSISVLLSFGLFANEQGTTSLYNSAKSDINEEQKSLKSSEERSKLRNQETLNQLRNSILDENISTIEKELKLKKLNFKLDNVPPEYLDNFEQYLNENYFNPKVEQKYPSIQTGRIKGRDSFPLETYAIDQQILIPQLRALQQPKKNTISTIKEPILLQPIMIEPIADDIPPILVDTKPVVISDTNGNQSGENDYGLGDFEDIATLMSPEELEKIKIALRGTDLNVDTKKNNLQILNEEAEVAKDYSKIVSANIREVFIFGNDKSVDLNLDIYVGDGMEGENYNDILRDVKENQIISVKGYNYKIDSISFSEVVIVNMKTNEAYVASKSLRTIN